MEYTLVFIKMKTNGSIFGGALIVAGTTIGAGLLAIPIISAQLGFIGSLLLMFGICALMTYTAFVTIEINLYLGKGTNISCAAEQVLGKWGRMLSTFSILLLYYALLSAYIAGGTSTIKEMLSSYLNVDLPSILPEILFTMILGYVIYSCTKAVDHLNRVLFTIKLIIFVVLVCILFPAINQSNLLNTPSNLQSVWAMIAIFVTSFGFHGSIPSIIDYVGTNPKRLFLTFLVGSLIPLAIYIVWEWATLGVLPLVGPFSFDNVYNNNNDVGTFIGELNSVAGGSTITWATNGFAALAIATSFLGVGIGLFDFFIQKGNFSNKTNGRLISAFLTFLIPFVFAIFYPQGFVIALTYAGLALTIIAVIMPSLIALKIRRRQDYNPSYKAPGGTFMLVLTFLIGCGIILNEVIALVF